MTNCKNRLVKGYLTQSLSDDKRLEFLLHVDECSSCWDRVYLASREQHPHYYKNRAPRKSSQRKDPQFIQSEEALFEVA